jgi:TRAP-type mannitol/chloroaromatic compound transport system permease small subunit
MQKLLLTIDKISTFVGQAFSWLIVALTLMISWEVFSRYVLDHPHSWAFDVMIIMYGTLFMMAGPTRSPSPATSAATCSTASSGRARRRRSTSSSTSCSSFRVVFALTYAGYYFAAESWAIRETSNITAEGPPIYPFKIILPLSGAFLLAQGVVEIIRCVICIKQGEWPSREEDVQEVDVDKLKEMVHVKDEDIARLDQLVLPKEGVK